MYKKHLRYVQIKILRYSIFYVVLTILSTIGLYGNRSIFMYGILFVILFLFSTTIKRYVEYMFWIKKHCRNKDFALIVLVKQPYLFFAHYNGFKLPLKQYALPLNKQVYCKILDKIKAVDTNFNINEPGYYDVVLNVNYEVSLCKITEEEYEKK